MPSAKVNKIYCVPFYDPWGVGFAKNILDEIMDRFAEIGFDPFSGSVEWGKKLDREFFQNRRLMIVRDTAGGREITFY